MDKETPKKHDAQPQSMTLAKLAGALGVSTDWLISGTGEPPTKESVCVASAAAGARLRLDAEAESDDSADPEDDAATGVSGTGRPDRCAAAGGE